jgi:hypothetical protein
VVGTDDSKALWRLTPLDVVLGVDFFLLVAPALMGVSYWLLGELDPGLPLEAAGALALAFLARRATKNRHSARLLSENPARRVTGLLLIGVGMSLTLVGGAIVVFVLMNLGPREEAKHLLLLPLLALPLLMGNALVYAGAALRSPAPSLPPRGAVET